MFFAAADHATLLDEFGVDATFGAATVRGVFDSGFAAAQAAFAVGVEGAQLTFRCRSADVPGIAHGATITIYGVAYTVRGVQPDGMGLVMLILEAP